jgi:hypothetical protein
MNRTLRNGAFVLFCLYKNTENTERRSWHEALCLDDRHGDADDDAAVWLLRQP